MDEGDAGEVELEARAEVEAGPPPALVARFALGATVMVSLLAGLHWYIGSRLVGGLQLTGAAAAAGWALVWGMFATLFIGFIGGRVLRRPVAKGFQWLGFVWMGAFALLLASLAASDLALGVVGLFTPVEPAWLTARAAAVLALVVPALAWGFITARAPAVQRLTVDVPGLHPDLDGFTLAQLSDVHIGETLDRRFSELLAKMVGELNADAVVITGDMVDGPVARLRDDVAPLGALPSRHGTFWVSGNHEYYSGVEGWVAEVRRLGMTVLHNEHRVLRRGAGELVLGGVPDLAGGGFSPAHRPDVHAAFAGAPAGVPRVLLAHQPRFARAAKVDGVALMLSGHTHGGQIFPFNFFVRLQQPVVDGFHVIDGVPTYTSKGTGYWGPPFRIGARGEVTLITLRAR